MRAVAFVCATGAVLWLSAPAQAQAPLRLEQHVVVRTTNERSTLNRATGEIVSTVDVTLINLGGRDIAAPLHALVMLSDTGVVVTSDLPVNAGVYAVPHVDVSPRLTGARLQSGEAASFQLSFRRPRDLDFTYSVEPRGPLIPVALPSLTVPSGPFSVDEGGELLIPVSATGATLDPLMLGASPVVNNAHFAATNGAPAAGQFRFSPDLSQAGFYTVQFRVTDALGNTVTTNVLIEVRNINQPPVLDPLAPRTVNEGDLVVVDIPANDPDGDLLTLEADPLPPNAALLPASRRIVFAPDFDQAGNYSVQVQVSDGSATAAPQVVIIDVIDVPLGTAGDSNTLALAVDPVSSPTLVARQRVSGFVNGGTNLPPREPATVALITGLAPAVVRQGETVDVLVTGSAAGPFATHFDATSRWMPIPGITVDRIQSTSASQLTATLTVGTGAQAGPRDVSVQTSNETAISLVSLQVLAGTTSLTGKLVNAETTNAIAGAIISVQGTSFATVSGPDGSFALHGLPPGDYVLVLNPPNHDLVRWPFRVTTGADADLGMIPTQPTVFDPSAPASLSPLSLLGRGASGFSFPSAAAAREVIRDAVLLVGGFEAGLLDAYGNQLNPSVDGLGYISLEEEGVRLMADRTMRGESTTLADILLPFSFAFEWSDGTPLDLQGWLDGLQDMVDEAWADPRNPTNYLALLMFNHGKTLLTQPPVVSSSTRLTPLQQYLFVMSMLSYMLDPQGTSLVSRADTGEAEALAVHRSWLDLVMPPAYAAGPPAPSSERRWTGFWSGFSIKKNKFMEFQLAVAQQSFIAYSVVSMVGAAGGLAGTVAVMPIQGLLAAEMLAAFGNLAFAARVPEPPRLLYAEVVPGPRGKARVNVHYRRSSSDLRDGRFVYNLYRFRADTEGRVLANIGFSTNAGVNELVITDNNPIYGASFCALTVAHIMSMSDTVTVSELSSVAPWWTAATFGLIEPISHLAQNRNFIMSDYSDPAVVQVTPGAAFLALNDIAIDPQDGDVYYSDRNGGPDDRALYRIPDLGQGALSLFTYAGFANPGQHGLAIDADGGLYMENAASDARFGGRIFRYAQPDGAREFVGSINYYSRDLLFANPVSAGPMAMGPPAAPSVSPEDLFVVDMLAGQVKRAPVRATYDPFRRIAQPYANLPVAGRPVDLEVTPTGGVFLLVSDARTRGRLSDREKGSMHIPPGAPVRQECPENESDAFADPVYPFSGEFYETVEDIRIKGVGLDFVWTRKYRSKIGVSTVQGNNWDYSYNIFITRNTNTGGIVVHDGHTRADEYQRSGTNDLWTLNEFFRDLTRASDGTYTLEFEDKGRWRFYGFNNTPSDGRIMQSIDRFGNTLQFTYDPQGRLAQVLDTLGRPIIFAYNSDGYIDQIVDFAGRFWRYEYYTGEPGGNPGDLKAVIRPPVTGTPRTNDFPLGKRVSYTYSTGFTNAALNGNLLTITDGRRNDPSDPTFGQGPYVRNIYATTQDVNSIYFDRIVRQEWGYPGEAIDFAYVPVNPTEDNGGAVVRVIINDREGHVKEYFYNERNQCTIKREFTGKANRSLPTTEGFNRPVGKLRETDPDYFETRYVWNNDSLKRREIHPNGNITEWVYEADLNPAAPARTRANIREIRRLPGTHTPAGSQTSLVERFEYDTSFGRGCCGFNFVTRKVDGRGNETRTFYDASGNVTTVVHRVASIREDFAYDARGRMVLHIHPDNGSGHRKVDRMEYYGPGDGIQHGYLKRIVADDGFAGLAVSYAYDAVGNTTNIVDARGHDRRFDYNALDQIVRSYSAETFPGSGVRYETDYFFDANDNLVRTDVINRDENGAVDPANSHFSVFTEYEILNFPVRTRTETEAGRFVVTERQYDRNRNPSLIRSGVAVNGSQPANTTRMIHDERDLLYRIVRAPGSAAQSTEQLDYDRNGNLVRNARGLEGQPRIQVFEHDGYNRKVRETDPMGNVTAWTYDAGNMPTQVTRWGELVDAAGDANNLRLSEVHMVYDAISRLERTDVLHFNPSNQTAYGDGISRGEMEYNDAAQVTVNRDDADNIVTTEYDTAGRVHRTTDALGNTTTYTYDGNGNILVATVVETSDLGGPPRVYVTSNTYDNLNRLVQTVDPAGATNRYAYDSRNNLVLMIDALGNRTRFTVDGRGRTVRTTHELTDTGTGAGAPAGTLVTMAFFDDNDRVTNRVDATGFATRYTYDALDRPVAMVLPDGTVNQAWYDIQDNVVSNRDANGTVALKQYDRLNRLVRTDYLPGPGVYTGMTFEAHAYDGASRVVRSENNHAVVLRTYDSLGNTRSETLNGLTTHLAYDGAGRPTALTYPGGRAITNQFDALNHLRVVADAGGMIAAFDYQGPPRLAQRTHRNNTRMQLEYDQGRRAVRTVHVRDPAGTPVTLDDRDYQWDPAYNKVARSNRLDGVNQRFIYDSVYRMVQSTQTGTGSIDYRLDAAGNRTNVLGGPQSGAYVLAGGTPEPADAPVHQYTATPSGTRTYDRNGNLLTVTTGPTNVQAFVYDARNRMVAMNDPARGITARYRYDAFGRRTERVVDDGQLETVRYWYDGSGRVVEERDAANAVAATYVFGVDIDEVVAMRRDGQDFYFHQDDMMNVVKVTDAAGAVVEQYAYDDFGRTTIRTGGGAVVSRSAIGNPLQFQGRHHDRETGFYYLRSRYLEPSTGRFTSRDGISAWGDPKNLGNGNTYAGNNPWTHRDPYGTYFLSEAGGSFGGFMSGLGQSGINFIAGVPQLAYAAATDLPGLISGIEQLGRTILAGDRDGFIQMMYPDIYKGMLCWDYLTEFERGYIAGRIVGVLGESVAGGASAIRGLKSAANGVKNLQLARAARQLAGADPATESVPGLKFRSSLKQFEGKAATQKNIVEIFRHLDTPESRALADLIENKSLKINWSSNPMAKAKHYLGFFQNDQIYLVMRNIGDAIDAAVTVGHEYKHLLDARAGVARGTKHFEYRAIQHTVKMGFFEQGTSGAHAKVVDFLDSHEVYRAKPDGGLVRSTGLAAPQFFTDNLKQP